MVFGRELCILIFFLLYGLDCKLAVSCSRDELAHHGAKRPGLTILRSLHMSLTTTTVLGKRNRVTSETLLLQLSASESNHEQSDVSWQELESEVESPQTLPNSKQKSAFVLVNGSLVKNGKKKYHCTFSGCKKTYSKPCRLEEHERSHTGEVRLSIKISDSIFGV